MTQNLELTIGREYDVRLYPKKEQIKAEYRGEAQGTMVFSDNNFYIFVDTDHSTIDNKIVTHESVSSIPIYMLGKNNVAYIKKDSQLKKILTSLGEVE